MRKERERGAIVVEATISLSMFIFAIFTILSIVNICYIQAKMSIALNTAAKEISQYSYLYYKFNMDKAESKLNDKAKESRKMADDTIDGIGTMLESFSGVQQSLNAGDFEKMMTEIQTGSKSASSIATMYGEKLAKDPKGLIVGMATMAGNELKEEAKTIIAQVLAKAFMGKNLKAFQGDTAEDFLRRYHVVDGMKGLDFNYSTLMAYGTSNQIVLVVTYDVEVIKLLNIDFKFTFRQCAKTTAWGRGISKIEPEDSTPAEGAPDSVWDMPAASRGKSIVESEKKNYTYTSAHSGYDAYNNQSGKNEFVSVISINTHDDTYSSADKIQYRLNKAYSDMESSVSHLTDPLEVKNKNGDRVTVASDTESRTYKIVLVVPEDASDDLVRKAKEDFLSKWAGSGTEIKVEIKKAYGSPKAEKEDESNETE